MLINKNDVSCRRLLLAHPVRQLLLKEDNWQNAAVQQGMRMCGQEDVFLLTGKKKQHKLRFDVSVKKSGRMSAFQVPRRSFNNFLF